MPSLVDVVWKCFNRIWSHVRDFGSFVQYQYVGVSNQNNNQPNSISYLIYEQPTFIKTTGPISEWRLTAASAVMLPWSSSAATASNPAGPLLYTDRDETRPCSRSQLPQKDREICCYCKSMLLWIVCVVLWPSFCSVCFT